MINSSKSTFQFGLLSIILLGNLIGMFGMHFFGEHVFWLSIKDLILGVLLLFNLIALRELPQKFLIGVIPFVVYISIMFFVGDATTMAKISSTRQALVPFAIACLGFYLSHPSRNHEQFQKWHMKGLYVLVAASIVVYVGLQFEVLPIKEYAKSKSIVQSYYGVPYMYYDHLTGNMIRNVSSFLDPINLGHAMAFLFIFGLYKAKYSKFILALILVSLLLTTSKGAFLHLVLALFIIERNRFPQWMQFIGFASLIPLLILASKYHLGVALHLEGLKQAITHISLFGEGLAKIGNQAVMFGNEVSIPIYDTFIGSILGQFGIVGLLLWIAPFVFILIKIKNRDWLFALLLVQLLVACISENTFNYGSIFFLMLSCGYYLRPRTAHE